MALDVTVNRNVTCSLMNLFNPDLTTGTLGYLRKAHRKVPKFSEGEELFSSTWRLHVKSSTS